MPYTQTKANPFPKNSTVVDKALLLTIDWLKYFNGLGLDLIRTMSSYDPAVAGSANLVAGTVVVANTQITSTSLLRLTAQNVGAGAGFLSIVLDPGVGFTINSSNGADTRSVLYEILEAYNG